MVPERVCDFVCQTRRDLFKGLPCLRIIIIIPFTRTLDDQNSLVFVHFTLYLKSTNAIIVPLSHTRARTHTHFLSLSLVQLATRESFVDVLVSRVQCSGLSTFLRTYCTVGIKEQRATAEAVRRWWLISSPGELCMFMGMHCRCRPVVGVAHVA